MENVTDLGLELTARLDTLGVTLDALEVDASGTLVRERTTHDARPIDGSLEETLAAPTHSDTLTTSVGSSFTVGETIGQGGIGLIRVATQHALRREVVVKSIRPDVEQRFASDLVLQEAWFTGMLEHPNIVPIYDISHEASTSPMILMKRIEGQAWSELIGPDGVKTSELDRHMDILRQVANAVHYAHSKGVMHRDLKPDNVMIGAFGEVYVLDWGIALAFDGEHEGLPSAREVRHVAGTPRYMAPEMACADGATFGPATDVYLLGAILFEVLTGSPPHAGETITEIMQAAYTSKPATFESHVDAGFAAIATRAMAREQTARYPSAEAFRDAIEACQQRQHSRALSEQAQESLEALEAWLDAPRVEAADHGRQRAYELLSACRFGFNQALSDWPENEAAREGLQRALTRMVRYELTVGSSRAAAALVAALPTPDPALAMLVEAGAVKTQRAVARLRELEAAEDLSAGERMRAFGLGGAAAFVLLTGAAMGHLDRSALWPMGHLEMITYWVAHFFVTLPLLLAPERYLPRTRINLNMTTSLVFMLFGYVLLWVYAWREGWSVEQTLVVNFQLGAMGWGLIALATDRVLFILTLAFLCAVLMIPQWPWAKFEIMAVAGALGLGGAGLVWRIRSLGHRAELGR